MRERGREGKRGRERGRERGMERAGERGREGERGRVRTDPPTFSRHSTHLDKDWAHSPQKQTRGFSNSVLYDST